MVGKKTREQQLKIIEKRENTAGADDGSDVAAELKKSPEERRREKPELSRSPGIQEDDRVIIRGGNQESEHHKRRQR